MFGPEFIVEGLDQIATKHHCWDSLMFSIAKGFHFNG